jgi:hypothetical protein
LAAQNGVYEPNRISPATAEARRRVLKPTNVVSAAVVNKAVLVKMTCSN